MTSATLNGNLTDTGGGTTQVYVYWGSIDGGTNKAGWGNMQFFGTRGVGPLSTNLSGLSGDTQYYYRYYATNANGGSWAPSTPGFKTATDLSAYGHKLKIAFGGYNRAETLTNFPALVVFSNNVAGSGFDYSTFLTPNGCDLQ
jgi:hypothetical protein